MPDSTRAGALQRWISENRIYVLLLLVFSCMACIAPHFFTLPNQTTILKGMSLSMPAAIGFTIVMIGGQLDLSIGTNLTLGGMMAIGLQPHWGWEGSILAALLCGITVGLINGVLVAKVKVDSFIATLGTMTITQGLIYMFCHGGTLTLDSFQFGTWMETPFLPLLSPRVFITVLLLFMAEFLLLYTHVGRNIYLVGGNPTTAWNAGLPVDHYIIGAFVISGFLACLGGVLFGIGINSAMPTMGNNSLMEVVAAVIIGGTSMTGGRGSVVKSMVALIALTMLYNGLECLGAGWEIRKIASGVVLAAIVLFDARAAARQRILRGHRHELLDEWNAMRKNENSNEWDTKMDRKDTMTFALATVGVVGCVAITAIFAMYFAGLQSQNVRYVYPEGMAPSKPTANTSALTEPGKIGTVSEAISTEEAEDRMIASLKSLDGQPLILPPSTKPIPPRPENPDQLPEDDPLRWYDMEYSGWGVTKVNIPKSPGGGPHGKTVIYLRAIDHPYHTAVARGMEKVAQVYGIQMKYKTANNDINIQNQQVEQVINERPDLVIISPVDAKACTPLFRKLNEAGIPTIAINLLTSPESHKYLLAWTGPDDWQQFRLLTHEFAKRMNYEGGYCIIQHRPGSSPFFSRTWSVITELKKIAPKMKFLAMQTAELESEKAKDIVSGWITRFGSELKGISCADDSGSQVGVNEAVKNANREDIIRIAAGNSKVGMDFVKEGRLHAITYQSPEADGAIPMKLAADWFYGKPIEPIRYLPIAIITLENVEQFLPAQW
ncbi:MAG: substrate-binding domain-containing protein [bacterium]